MRETQALSLAPSTARKEEGDCTFTPPSLHLSLYPSISPSLPPPLPLSPSFLPSFLLPSFSFVFYLNQNTGNIVFYQLSPHVIQTPKRGHFRYQKTMISFICRKCLHNTTNKFLAVIHHFFKPVFSIF